MVKQKVKKSIFIYLLILISAVVLVSCNNNPVDGSKNGPNNNPEFIYVIYYAGYGGYLSSGEWHQKIRYGENGTEVTVEANEGYIFTDWSDGVTTATRKELNAQSNLTLSANFQKIVLTASYSAATGGSVSGTLTQSINYGDNTSSVTAVPDTGFLFAGWSDGIKSNPRQDFRVKSDVTACAQFVPAVKTFNYNYNKATGGNTAPDITVSYGRLNESVFAIPQREHFLFNGWYLESDFKTKVTSESGILFLGDGLFFADSNNLYAKWIAEIPATYKILLVFVDEIHAVLKTAEGLSVPVDYKMSYLERMVCERIPFELSDTLNDLFDGLVTFEIDAYFTTVPLGTTRFLAV